MQNNELIEIRCHAGQLLAKADKQALSGTLEFKCKRCRKIHKFVNGIEVKQ